MKIQSILFALCTIFLSSCKHPFQIDHTRNEKESIFRSKDDVFIDSILRNLNIPPKKLAFKQGNIFDTSFFFWRFPVFDTVKKKYFNVACKDCDTVNDGMTNFIYLNEVKFSQQTLVRIIIPEPTIYKLAVFTKPVKFMECQFVDSKDYMGHDFRLSDAKFDSALTIENCQYRCETYFDRCKFNNGFYFANDHDTTEKKITFKNCKSETLIQFKIVYAPDIISNSAFAADLIFENDTIAGKIDMSNASFKDGSKLIYKGTTLPDTFDLSNMSLTGDIDLREAYPNILGKKCEINLVNTDIKKIKMQYTNFHLYFPREIYNGIRYKDLVSSTYESLLKNFKENGYEESYNKLDVEYKDWQAKSNFWMWISGWWWNYGYEKWRVLIWTLMALLIFSLINATIYEKLYGTYSIEQLNKTTYEYSKYSFIRGLENYWLSIMYTGFIFFRLSIDFDKIKIKSWGILFLIFFEYAIGLLFTGYILNWVLSK